MYFYCSFSIVLDQQEIGIESQKQKNNIEEMPSTSKSCDLINQSISAHVSSSSSSSLDDMEMIEDTNAQKLIHLV